MHLNVFNLNILCDKRIKLYCLQKKSPIYYQVNIVLPHRRSYNNAIRNMP